MGVRSSLRRAVVFVCPLSIAACGGPAESGAGAGGGPAMGGSSLAQGGSAAGTSPGNTGGRTEGSAGGNAGSSNLTLTGGLSGQGGAGSGGNSSDRTTGGALPNAGGTRNTGTKTTATGGSAAGSSASEAGGTLGSGGATTSSKAAGGGTGGKSTGGRSGATGGAGVGGNAGGTAGLGSHVGGAGGSTGGSTQGTGGTSAVSGTASDGASIIPDPSWTCGMPNGIPVPTLGELVLSATLDIDKTHEVGLTQFGSRRLYTVKSGRIEGKQVQATVLTGGLDLELTLSNGSIELEEINVLKANDGTLIYMRTCGVAPAGEHTVRIVPDFEVATSKSLSWLNTGKYAGTRVVDAATGTIRLEVYDVSDVAVSDPKLEVKDPTGVSNQPWDCSTATGAKGSTLFTESVTLG